MGALKFLVVALVVFGAGAVGAADKEPALFQIRQGDAIGLIDRIPYLRNAYSLIE